MPTCAIVYFGAPPLSTVNLYGIFISEIDFDRLETETFQDITRARLVNDYSFLHFDGSDDKNYYYHISNGGTDNLIEIIGSYTYNEYTSCVSGSLSESNDMNFIPVHICFIWHINTNVR